MQGDADRPNFLLIITDQHRADHLGCYGHPQVATPSIDALAARGITFDRCYVTSPICMPNRAAIATGRMPSVNGVKHSGIPLPLEATTFVEQLRGAGYRTALVGKAHLQTQRTRAVADARLDLAVRRDWSGPEYLVERMDLWARDPDRQVPLPYYGFEQIALACGHGDEVEGHYTRWLLDRCRTPERLRGPANALSSSLTAAPQAWRTAVPEELHPTTFVADETVRCLDELAADSRPFFIQCSFPDPHHPFTPPGRYWDRYSPEEVALPRSFAVRQNEASFMRALRALNADPAYPRGPFCTQSITAEGARAALALTFGMIGFIDQALGRILQRLADLGIANRTVVVFTSDHGDLLGDHGLVFKQAVHYEGVIRVPLIWADPLRTSRRTSNLASSLDIGPTILARAGITPAWGVQGNDLSGAMDGASESRDGVLIEEEQLPIHMGSLGSVRLWSYLTQRYRLTLWQGYADGELFDRQSDPDETCNRWNDPSMREVRAELTEALLRERMRLSDPLPLAHWSA